MDDRTYLLKKNEALYEATLDTFSTVAFSEASLNDIIKTSGTNKGSFYYRFKNKEDLYLALLEYIYVKQKDFLSIPEDTSDLFYLLDMLFDSLRKINDLDSRFLSVYKCFFREDEKFQHTVNEKTILSPLRQYEPYIRKAYLLYKEASVDYDRFFVFFKLVYVNFHLFVRSTLMSNKALIHQLTQHKPDSDIEKTISDATEPEMDDELGDVIRPRKGHLPFSVVDWNDFLVVRQQHPHLLKNVSFIDENGSLFAFGGKNFLHKQIPTRFRFLKTGLFLKLFSKSGIISKSWDCITNHPTYFSFFEHPVKDLNQKQMILFSLIKSLDMGYRHVFLRDADQVLDDSELIVLSDIAYLSYKKTQRHDNVYLLHSKKAHK